jgi:murein DD-endopeptidase MepM/ murein hydrolase activator NlpD
MTQRWVFSVSIIGLAGLALASGCSTVRPRPNERRGLFSGWVSRQPAAEARADSTGAEASGNGANETLVAANRLKLYWPLRKVQITSRFGRRSRDFHEGIDLKARVGTPVYAAQKGRVLYAGARIRGYGYMIVIKHAYGIATVYAHNSRLLVRKGDRVKLGQRIAMSGSTGRSTGPHLHFEVRHGVSAVDPARLVPMSRVACVGEEVIPGRSSGARVAHR